MDSLWLKTAEKPKFKELLGDIKTDVLIVGGGLTGILCAYMLKEAGVDYTLIEAKEICGGITKNTTAKITVEHSLIYDKIMRKYGTDAARLYYTANERSISRYRDLCKKTGSHFETRDNLVYSLNGSAKILKEVEALRKIGASAEFVNEISLPFYVSGAVKLKNQGQFHPLEFLYKLSKGLNIKENTKLINLKPHLAETNKGKISFKKAIIATHFPLINKHGAYFLKMYQHRSYVIALKNAPRLDGMYIDQDEKGLSFRNFGEYLLLGGGSHRTSKRGGGFESLENFAKKHYPESEIKYRWATQDCMTLDGMMYVGRYSKNTADLYVSTGYNKWGFTSAMAAAEILRDLILEKKNDFADLFSPSRSILHPQLAINALEATFGLLTPTVPRCPHMGCALKYNKYEHSWDCSCHGSRFAKNGEVIDNPATDDKLM